MFVSDWEALRADVLLLQKNLSQNKSLLLKKWLYRLLHSAVTSSCVLEVDCTVVIANVIQNYLIVASTVESRLNPRKLWLYKYLNTNESSTVNV